MPKSKITLFAQKLPDKSLEYERPQDFDDFERDAPPGRYVIEIKRKRPPKSEKQRGMIFGLMIESAIRQADEQAIGVEELMRYLLTRHIPKGVKITKDYLHALMYIICPTFNDEGIEITLSKMDTKEAAELFERFRNIMAPIGIVIDDPDPNWKNKK